MKLVSMTDKVLEIDKLEFNLKGKDYADEWSDFCLSKLDRINQYAKFLKLPLELGMFVPCDENGNVLEIPQQHKVHSEKGHYYDWIDKDKYEQYQQAKDRVLFEGFTFGKETVNAFVLSINDETYLIPKDDNTEGLIENFIPDYLTLTASAIKKYNL